MACHAEVTKAQQKERKEARKEERRKAEELLRNAVNQLKDDVSSSSAVQVSSGLSIFARFKLSG